ncbi:MAG: PEGA domain-containing protein [Bacteroidales bacterium]|nr:PEGA domain-containing protein [Bacteroidales bacterium]
MKCSVRLVSVLLVVSLLVAGCSSTTLIQSKPNGAKVYMDGQYVGETPYSHTDTRIVGSSTMIKLVKEGYKPYITTMTRNEEVDVSAIIGGLFFAFPYLWTMKYQPFHTYELAPLNDQQPIMTQPVRSTEQSDIERLKSLKQLLDEKILTQEEFEKEKAKILESSK